MKIAVIGAGFTGLTAALKLSKAGHDVTVFEKEATAGGLASGFKEKGWDWYLDKTYHHLFTNDLLAKDLASEVGQRLITTRPQTAVLADNESLPFDSPLALLKFSKLPIVDRLRVGICTAYLKYLSNSSQFEKKSALIWLEKFMGKKSTDLIWNPLFESKFGVQKNNISLTWFWARIKKRTTRLIYPEGGFQSFSQKICDEIKNNGGQIIFNKEIKSLDIKPFDKVIVTLPTETFIKVAKLPKKYKDKISSIPHLTALNLILTFNKPFIKKGAYWLNITDKSFPFMVLCEHTNFMNKKYYGNKHILYIGCYLPNNHPFLKKSPAEILKIFDPFLLRINPSYKKSLTNKHLFIFPNAQPVVDTNYKNKMPDFKTPLKNVYLANLDMVYPWDRGVNYAISKGAEIAKIINGN